MYNLKNLLVAASITCLTTLLLDRSALADPAKFDVMVQRGRSEDGLLTGKISVNGKEIGTTYEPAAKKIPAGAYKGALRTTSMKNFVQGPGGKLGKSGDFLLEIAGVPGRSDILFHSGNKADESTGCIMLGPATTDPATGDKYAPPALKKLRRLFFDGDDTPDATPDKAITIEVRDP